MKPLYEAGEFVEEQGLYFKKCKEASGGAPIYKMHPGLACIAITDHASTKWFMSQPESVLDRQVSGRESQIKSLSVLNDMLACVPKSVRQAGGERRNAYDGRKQSCNVRLRIVRRGVVHATSMAEVEVHLQQWHF